MASEPGERPYTLVRPVMEQRSRDERAEAEARQQGLAAWQRWDTACAQAPRCRAILEQIKEQLPQVEANLAAADRALAAAQWAYVRREVIGPGGEVLQAPTGEITYMTHADEVASDPGVAVAAAERQKWLLARGRLWAHAAEARAVLAAAEYQKPPGEHPQ